LTEYASIVFKFSPLPGPYKHVTEGKAGKFLLPGPDLRLRFWWIGDRWVWDW
jgi:hypothetical protein